MFDTSPLRRWLLLVVSFKIALLVLAIDPGANNPFEIPKIVASRIGAFASAGILGAILMRFGLGVVPRTPMHLGVAGLAVAYVVSLAFAEDRYVGLFGEPGSYLGATFALDMLVTYVAVATAVRRQRDWAAIGLVCSAAAALALLYGVAQRVGWDPIRWTEDSSGHAIATFGNANLFAHFLSVTFGAALALFLIPPPVARARLLRAAASGVVLASGLMIALGGARGALVGIAVALAVAVVLFVRVRSVTRPPAIVLAGAAVAVLLLVALVTVTPLGERIAQTAAGRGLQDRALIYDSALRAFAERPFVGHGPDSFGVVYPRFRQAGSGQVLGVISEVSAHSWVLNTAATLGALGLGATIFAIGTALVLLWRALPGAPWLVAPVATGFVAYWANGLVSIGNVAVDWIPWLCFGLAAAHAGSGGEPRSRHAPSGLVAVPIALGLLAALFPLNMVLADRDLASARAAYGTGNAAAATSAARSAVSRDEGRADHWNWLGLAYTLSERWSQAGDAFEQATRRSPHRVTYWANLAQSRMLQAVAGDASDGGAAAALEAARRGAAADPNDVEGQTVLSQVAARLGDQKAAISAAERLIELEPTRAGHYDWAASIYEAAGEHAAAVERFEQATRMLHPDTSNAPAERRLRLAQLYAAAGQPERARSLVRAPALVGADPSCTPLHGYADIRPGGGDLRPKCVRVVFDIEAPLRGDGQSGAANEVSAYTLGGAPLPAGTSVHYEGGRFVVIQLPQTAVPPGRGTPLTAQGIQDVFGNVITRDAAQVTLE